MTTDNDVNTINEPAKRGRAPKTKPARRNFAAELGDLQQRVNIALRILDRINAASVVHEGFPGSTDHKAILDIAIATLREE